MLPRFVVRSVECRGGPCVGVLGRFWQCGRLVVSVCVSGTPFVWCDCMNAEVMDRCMHLK